MSVSAQLQPSWGVLALNICIVLVFGVQHLSTYFPGLMGTTLALYPVCFALMPVIGLEAYWYRNKFGDTWHEKFGGTPISGIFLAICYLCFWSMVVHVGILLATSQCDICDGNPAAEKWFFHHAYWLHVLPSGLIAIAGPLQYTPAIRKAFSFAVHRWLGRVLLMASVVHQASATVLFVSEEFYSRVDCLPGDPMCGGWPYRFYVAGFIPKNLVSWAAIVLGWRAARQKRIAEHGRWMYRLGAMWVITIVVAHLIVYPVFAVVGPTYKYAVGEWVEWFFVVPAEIYIRKSGRFKLEEDATVAARGGKTCPFLLASERDLKEGLA